MHPDAFGCIGTPSENFGNVGPKNAKNLNFGRDGLCEPVPRGQRKGAHAGVCGGHLLNNIKW